MIAVLDTNVLVSALITPFGSPGRVLDLMLDGALRLAYDDRLLGEYRQVLARSKFGFEPTAVSDLLDYLVATGEAVIATPLPSQLPDPDDQAFLEVAAASGAALITGNLRHFPSNHRGEVEVLSPAEFLARWQGSDAGH